MGEVCGVRYAESVAVAEKEEVELIGIWKL